MKTLQHRANKADGLHHFGKYIIRTHPIFTYIYVYVGLPLCMIGAVALVAYGVMLPASALMGWI